MIKNKLMAMIIYILYNIVYYFLAFFSITFYGVPLLLSLLPDSIINNKFWYATITICLGILELFLVSYLIFIINIRYKDKFLKQVETVSNIHLWPSVIGFSLIFILYIIGYMGKII